MRIEQPFHEGEIEAQRRAGETAAAARNGKAIADEIMPGALKFIEQQRLAAAATVAPGGDVWASVLFGAAGFIAAPDRRHVRIDVERLAVDHGDPLWSNLTTDPRMGLLLIEFSTRRRLRLNGSVSRAGPASLCLAVEEAYPNCPQYIRPRDLPPAAATPDRTARAGEKAGARLLPDQRRRIASAETLFVASAHATRGADVSHRGGAPGFVSVLDDRTLRVPDYPGNGMFNTLGNLTLDPRAGLAFADFDSGPTLQLIGRTEIHWGPGKETGGGTRWWDFHLEYWREATVPLHHGQL